MYVGGTELFSFLQEIGLIEADDCALLLGFKAKLRSEPCDKANRVVYPEFFGILQIFFR